MKNILQGNKFKAIILNKKILILLLIIISVLIMLPSKNKDSETESNDNKSHNFVVQNISQESKTIFVESYGKISSIKNTMILPECTGHVQKILVNNGETVHQDQNIIQIDSKDKSSILASAQADLDLKTEEHDAEKSLYKKGYSSYIETLKAESSLKSSEQQVVTSQERLDSCTVKAPFTGKIDNFLVTEGAIVNENQTELVRIFDNSQYTAETYINEQDKEKVHIGQQVLIKTSGRTVMGEVYFISSVNSDNNSSYLVKALINYATDLPIASAAIVNISTSDLPVYQIPSPALALDIKGNVGIKIIDDRTVKFIPVEIVDEDEEGFWVYNKELSEHKSINVITLGHVFVQDNYEIPEEIFSKIPIEKKNMIMAKT